MTAPTRLSMLATALGSLTLSLTAIPLALISPNLTQSLLAWGAGELLKRHNSVRKSTGLKRSDLNPVERDVASTLQNQGIGAPESRKLARGACKQHGDDFNLALKQAITDAGQTVQ